MLDRLSQRIGVDVREGVPLSTLTTLQIGGPARYYCRAETAETLAAAIAAARHESIDHLLIGGGSNLLVADEGFDGLVIHNQMRGIEVDGSRMWVAGGESFHGLIERAAEAGLTGLGFAAGVPGTVGGAVFGNAGCYGEAIGDRIEELTLVDPQRGGRRMVGPAEMSFDYRHSALKHSGGVVESITIQLCEGDPVALRADIEDKLAVRRGKHPVDIPSAGSYFKNLPPDEPGGRRVAAGLLLDRCGCKGLRVGDAAVFERHANIIVNLGDATARDVLELAGEMKRRVRDRFGAELQEEVQHVGRIEPSSRKG